MDKPRLRRYSTVGFYYEDEQFQAWATTACPPVACARCSATVTRGYARSPLHGEPLTLCPECVVIVSEGAPDDL